MNNSILILNAIKQSAIFIGEQRQDAAIENLKGIIFSVTNLQMESEAAKNKSAMEQSQTIEKIGELIKQQANIHTVCESVVCDLGRFKAHENAQKQLSDQLSKDISFNENQLKKDKEHLEELERKMSHESDSSAESIVKSILSFGVDRAVSVISNAIDGTRNKINNSRSTIAALNESIEKVKNDRMENAREVASLQNSIKRSISEIRKLKAIEIGLHNQESSQRSKLTYFTEMNLFFINLGNLLNNISNRVIDVLDIARSLDDETPTICDFDPSNQDLITLRQAILSLEESLAKNNSSSSALSDFTAPLPNQCTYFTGAYAINNWTENTSATVNTLWDLSKLPKVIILNSDPKWLVSTDWITIRVRAKGLIKFNWECTSENGNQHPCYYNVNDTKVQLNSLASSGVASVFVNADDVFSISCGSCDSTQVSLTLSNFTAPLPQCTNFTGVYGVDNWIENTSATVSSLWDLSQLPEAIILNTDSKWKVSTDWMTIHVPATGLITFNWECTSDDSNQHPCYYNVNDTKTQLNSSATSGEASVFVNADDVFSISCGSCDAAPVSLTLSNFTAPYANQCTNFADAYAVDKWTENTSATVSSLWDLSQLPEAIILNTDPEWQVSTDWMTIRVPAKGIITFNWECTSDNRNQHPCYYNVNDTKVQLNSSAASGIACVFVNVDDVFSISCGSFDAAEATLTISNFTAPL